MREREEVLIIQMHLHSCVGCMMEWRRRERGFKPGCLVEYSTGAGKVQSRRIVEWSVECRVWEEKMRKGILESVE